MSVENPTLTPVEKRFNEVSDLADRRTPDGKFENGAWGTLPPGIKDIVVDSLVVVEQMTPGEVFEAAENETLRIPAATNGHGAVIPEGLDHPVVTRGGSIANLTAQEFYDHKTARRNRLGPPDPQQPSVMDQVRIHLLGTLIHGRVTQFVRGGNIPPGERSFGHMGSAISLATAAFLQPRTPKAR